MERAVPMFIFMVSFLIVLILLGRRMSHLAMRGPQRLPGLPGELKPGGTLTGVHDETDYEVYYYEGGKHTLPRLTVSIRCESQGRFEIERESGFDRLCKRYRITDEVQTFDETFDADYFIRSDTLAFVKLIFRVPEKRLAVRSIFDMGYERVEHDGEKMKCSCAPFPPEGGLSDDFVTGAVTALARLSKDCPVLSHSPSVSRGGAWKARRAVAFAVPIVGILVGLLLLMLGFANFPPMDRLPLFFESLKYSVPLLLLFLWIAVKLVRGRSTSHHALLGVAALALVAFPTAGMGVTTFMNGYLDDTAPSSHTVPLLHKLISRSNIRARYHLVLASWRNGRKTERLTVPLWDFKRAVPGQTQVRMETRPGRFGFEWKVSYQVLD